MTRLLLDTSAYAAFKAGRQEAVSALRAAEDILLPTVVIGELLAGFASGNRETENRSQLDAFLSSGRVRIVPHARPTAERYTSVYTGLRSAVRPIPANDIWIAASAMEHGAEILTADRHFQQVPQVLIRLLPA